MPNGYVDSMRSRAKALGRTGAEQQSEEAKKKQQEEAYKEERAAAAAAGAAGDAGGDAGGGGGDGGDGAKDGVLKRLRAARAPTIDDAAATDQLLAPLTRQQSQSILNR
jgi:hypothetical protein